MDRIQSASWRSRHGLAGRDWLWLFWTALLSGFLVVMAGRDLGDFPRMSGDDAWIMSASHKLASEGVFGSDLYRGFANSERHYFIALPVYHLLQAGVFALFGTSVAAARSLTLISGLAILWCVAWLARRWHGVAVAIVATGLLVIWRASLMNLAVGLSFLSVSRTGRYDATAVAFVLLSIVGFELLRGRERRWLALLTGLAAGLATMTQFFGAFIVPLIVFLLIVEQGWRVYREPFVKWLAGGWLAVVVPYALYVAAYWSDFTGQSELKAGRTGFGRPSFYLSNLLDEPDRYRHLFGYLRPALDGRYDRFDQPLSPFLFGVAAILALGFLATRLFRRPQPEDRLLAMTVAVPGLCLALVDGTNVPLYAVILLPFACIAIALMAVSALRWALRQRSLLLGAAVSVLVIAPAVIVTGEGIVAHRQEHEWSEEIVSYQDVSTEIDALLPEASPVLGSERWWAGLYPNHDYIAVSAIMRQLVEAGDTDHPDQLRELLSVYGVAAILVDEDCRTTIRRQPPWAQQQFEELIQRRSNHAGTLTLEIYGWVDIYVLR